MRKSKRITRNFKSLEGAIRHYSAPLVFVLVFLLITADILFPHAIVLTFTHVALIGILLLLPYVQYIQRVKWGPFEAELDRQIEETRKRVASLSAERNPISATNSQPIERQEQIRQQLLAYIDDDPKVAVVTLWIEIEKALKALVQEEQHQDVIHYREINRRLQANTDISLELLDSVHQIRNLRNEALYGDEISRRDAREIIRLGTTILDHLSDLADTADTDSISRPQTTQ
ncbi:hypothetical protein [Haladaptatus sp. DFWS20]|uniref:hypothetical protein n=1 Tax=Haladaptatus sp. DFWS20 TaxID=3403467 RepID=UPI003EB759A1